MSIICRGNGVLIRGDLLTVCSDFANITASVRSALCERLTQEDADKLIVLCGQLAYTESSNKKDQKEIAEQIADALSG